MQHHLIGLKAAALTAAMIFLNLNMVACENEELADDDTDIGDDDTDTGDDDTDIGDDDTDIGDDDTGDDDTGDDDTGPDPCDDADHDGYPGEPEDGDDCTPWDDPDNPGEYIPWDCDDTDPALNWDDNDGDGYATCDGDCDDESPYIYPGAQEDTDGVDQDCYGGPEVTLMLGYGPIHWDWNFDQLTLANYGQSGIMSEDWAMGEMIGVCYYGDQEWGPEPNPYLSVVEITNAWYCGEGPDQYGVMCHWFRGLYPEDWDPYNWDFSSGGCPSYP